MAFLSPILSEARDQLAPVAVGVGRLSWLRQHRLGAPGWVWGTARG